MRAEPKLLSERIVLMALAVLAEVNRPLSRMVGRSVLNSLTTRGQVRQPASLCRTDWSTLWAVSHSRWRLPSSSCSYAWRNPGWSVTHSWCDKWQPSLLRFRRLGESHSRGLEMVFRCGPHGSRTLHHLGSMFWLAFWAALFGDFVFPIASELQRQFTRCAASR